MICRECHRAVDPVCGDCQGYKEESRQLKSRVQELEEVIVATINRVAAEKYVRVDILGQLMAVVPNWCEKEIDGVAINIKKLTQIQRAKIRITELKAEVEKLEWQLKKFPGMWDKKAVK